MKFLFNLFRSKKPLTKKEKPINKITQSGNEKYKTLSDLDILPNFKAGIAIREMYQEDPDYFDRGFYEKLKKETRETKYDDISISVINTSNPFELIKAYSKWKYNKAFFSDEVYNAIKNKLNAVQIEESQLDELYSFFKLVKFYKFYLFEDTYRELISKIHLLQEDLFIPGTYNLTPKKASIFLNSKIYNYKLCFSPRLIRAINDLKNLDGFDDLQKKKNNLATRISKVKKTDNTDKIIALEEEHKIVKEEISDLIKNYFIYL